MALALFDGGGHAATAASVWRDAARTYARQQMVMLLGLAPVFDGLTVAAEGSRVHVRLHIGAERREGLAEKLLAVLAGAGEEPEVRATIARGDVVVNSR